MSDIAKKYIKALAKSVDKSTLEDIHAALSSLVPAFKNRKFLAIVQSSDISKADKTAFLLELTGIKEKKAENFLKLLVEKNRIGLIPSIVHELGRRIEEMNQQYSGHVISSEKVNEEAITEIQKAISKKLGVDIKLDNLVTDYPGMKVEVENLGLEIGLSTDRIKQQIAQTILSAI